MSPTLSRRFAVPLQAFEVVTSPDDRRVPRVFLDGMMHVMAANAVEAVLFQPVLQVVGVGIG